tara:strand:+ start:2648 stop:2749 length:102 start_codon:yes stop_codon:yes gene_type:complete
MKRKIAEILAVTLAGSFAMTIFWVWMFNILIHW